MTEIKKIKKQEAKLRKEIISILKQIPDPELGVSIWDLGLIYKIKIKGKKVEILMTLTTIGCPLFSEIAALVRKEVGKIPELEEVSVDLTFDPPWSIDRLSSEAKIRLGIML